MTPGWRNWLFAMALLAPNFLSVDNAVNVARAVSINAILAAGMTMIILTGGIDLSVGSTLAVAGVAGVLLATAGVPGWLAIIGGILAGALAGFVNGALYRAVAMVRALSQSSAPSVSG